MLVKLTGHGFHVYRVDRKCNQRDTENMITFLLEPRGDGTIVNRNLMSKMLIHPKT